MRFLLSQALLACCSLFALAGCGGGQQDTQGPTQTAASRLSAPGPSMAAVLSQGSSPSTASIVDVEKAIGRVHMEGGAPLLSQSIGGRIAQASSMGSLPLAKVAAVPATAGGALDLVWHNAATGQTVIWAMKGISVGSSANLLQLPNWKVTRTADLDGDGQQDLIWWNPSTHQIVAWIMNGSQAVQSSTLLQSPGWQIVQSADFDGDGKEDLLFHNASTGQTVMWLMNGTTVRTSQVLFTSTAWQVVHVGDLNGDSKADLIWRNAVTGQTAAWLMNGTSVMANSLLLDLPSWRLIHLGDLDGDGRDDLIWLNAGSGQTVAWLMNGLSVSGSASLFTHAEWRVTHIGDLDGDRRADLIWQRESTGEVAAWLMNGLGVKANSVLLANRDWQLSSLGDLNGDGNQDLLWRNAKTSQTVGWQMSGLSVRDQGVLLALGGWEISATRRTAAPTTPPPAAPGTVAGFAYAGGPVAGATVRAFGPRANTGLGTVFEESLSPVLATATTAADGSYRLAVGDHTGPLMVTVSGGSYFDAISGKTIALDSPLRAISRSITPGRPLHVSPLTDAVVAGAETYSATGYHVNVDSHAKIEPNVAPQLGFDPVTTRPLDPTLASALPKERLHGAYVAMFAAYRDVGAQTWRSVNRGFGYRGFSKPTGVTTWADDANRFASSALNRTGLPTLARLTPPNPLPSADDFANFEKTWDGTWSCPASITRNVDQCDLPGVGANCKSAIVAHAFSVRRELNMWCVPVGVALPTRAYFEPTAGYHPMLGFGKFVCPDGTTKHNTGWCLSHTWGAKQLYVPTEQAKYTPLPNAPTSIKTATGELRCPEILPRPADYPMSLKGQWCLAPGMEMPSLAVNNLCAGIDAQPVNGWCLRSEKISGQDYGMVRPVDPSAPPIVDAADPNRYGYGPEFKYTCPANTYSQAYVTTLTAFGAPKAPFTAESPCYSQSKSLAGAACHSDQLFYARAEATYNNCLAINSTEPYRATYAARATAASDLADALAKACPLGLVRRDGVCVTVPPPSSQPKTPSESLGKCADEYSGPDIDPQFDTFCKLAAFDACLHRTANTTAYDREGRAVCSTLDQLLKVTNGPKDYCKYCPYPY